MRRLHFGIFVIGAMTCGVLFSAGWRARAQEAKTQYPKMAPLVEYLMDRDAEIAMARSAAPDSISSDAEVMVLGQKGYETAVKGKNGFVCIVERSWTTESGDPEFWNPKLRGPLCLNPPAARTYLPLTIKKTEMILAGKSEEQMFAGIHAALDKKELPVLEPNAMCYMLSKQGYLNDAAGHWHPHLMFFLPGTGDALWGADLPGSPVIAQKDVDDRLTVLMIPVRRWSDGTADPVKD